MRIADLVPLKDPSITQASAQAELLTKDMDAIERVGHLLNTGWDLPRDRHQDRGSLVRKREDTLDSLEKLKVTMLCETGTLPDTMRGHSPDLAKLANTPSTTTDEVRGLADMLGFIVIPVEYLSPAAFSSEMLRGTNTWASSSGPRQAIDNFMRLKTWFEVYVLTPARFYDVRRHVEAADDKEIYTPEALAQTFMALNMSIPMFRSLFQESRDNKERTARLETGLAGLSQRVTALEGAMESAQRAALVAESSNATLRKEIAGRSVLPYDPMLVAFGKGIGILGTTRAFVGPCWGPDFPPVLEKIMQSREVPGQAKRLAASSARWANVSPHETQRFASNWRP